ncbi:MAG: LuxR C-terminal-related transcriptional regulator [Treponema sp.]|nr:LuxR C-terminal-related transcriptional regulator [Treponema sp.]
MDELSIRNIRLSMWPVLFIFPLSVIIGDLRYFDLKIIAAGFQSYELMLYPLGLGWLFSIFFPKRFIIHLLRISAVCSALLLPFQFLLTNDMALLGAFMAFQFFNGICASCAFFLFCFRLNNVERLFGMSLILFYYGFYYTIWRAFEIVQSVGKAWGGPVVMLIYLVVVFCLHKAKDEVQPGLRVYSNTEDGAFLDEISDTADGKGSGARLVIGLHIVYYTIMCMINYIEWAENIVYSLPYGLGSFASIALIIFIMLLINRSALYIWLMYLVFTLFGMCILIYDSQFTHFTGSLVYGLGDGLGYIIIYYLCAGAIKRSKSFKMFKLYCIVFFIEYFIISGIFTQAFGNFKGPNHLLALGVVLVLSSVCFLLLPVMQKKLFEADWTDGIYLHDVVKYTRSLEETQAINKNDNLNLTSREQEIFTMLLTGMNPKEIAYTLKVSYYTVDFHRKNLYRKLGIQSRAELFARYAHKVNHTHAG